MKSGRGKISSSYALLFPPWYGTSFLFLDSNFLSDVKLTAPSRPCSSSSPPPPSPTPPPSGSGENIFIFQIFKQHFVSRTYFYSSPRRRRLWPRRPHQGAHSVRAAPAEGGRETVCNIAKIIRKTWYCKKKFLQAPCGRTCGQQQQSRSTTATFTSTATFENTISRATTTTTFPIPYDLSLLLWRLSLLRLPLGQRGEKRLAGRILKKTIINVLFWGKKYCSNISYQFSPGRGAGVCLCVISVSCL